MSRERIIFQVVSRWWRLLAFLIDIGIIAILALVFSEGLMMEYDMFLKNIMPLDEAMLTYLPILGFMDLFPLYYIGLHAVTNGQTVGKKLLGIRVMTNDNQNTGYKEQGRRAFFIHFKRLILLRRGTKVIREVDPPVPELMD
ncbi:MAG: RDD family protein [Candidatus Hodarchaeota archaeon]